MKERLSQLCDKSTVAIIKADSLTQLLQFTLESIECSEQNDIRICGLLGLFVELAEGLEKIFA